MKKILITGGCSFSDCSNEHTKTWPKHLAEILAAYKPVHTGQGSHGNGIISRKVIYEVQHYLQQGVNPEDILVGVMWSGPNRYDIFSDASPPGYNDSANEETNLYENPTKFVRENSEKQWYIFNHSWQKNYFNSAYYKLYHNEVMHQLLTVEHILRVQWFLKSLNIKYFMSCYTDKVFSDKFTSHPEVKYLYDLIDFDQFLPIKGEYEWCRDISAFEFPDPNDMHPGSEQHQDFVKKVVSPWLESKGYI
jgi:hypothetical protein